MKDQRVSMRLRWEGAVGDNGLMMDVNPYQSPTVTNLPPKPRWPGLTPLGRMFLRGVLTGGVFGGAVVSVAIFSQVWEDPFQPVFLVLCGVNYGAFGGTLILAFGIVVYRWIYPEPNDASRDAARGSNQESAAQPQPFAPK